MGLTEIDLNKFELFQCQYLEHYLTANVAPMHREWNAALVDRSVQYLCLEAGRGSAKTTIGSVNFSLYNICESQDEEMQVFSRSAGSTGTATKIMRKIKKELETNKLLIEDYGLRRGSDWGKEALEIIRGDGHRIMFYSMGKHSSARGSRGTVLIDDPQNAADCRSETVLAADEDWLLEDIIPIIIGDQRLVFIGTPISPLSLLCTVKELEDFKVLSFPMENPPHSGKSAWPEMYPDEFLAQKLRLLKSDRYGAEYLCEPKVSGNPVFRAEWFKYYDKESAKFKEIKRDIVYRVLGGDCAESKATQADNTALVTLGATHGENPDIYVLDVKAGKWSTKEGAEKVLTSFKEHKQHKTVIESRVKEKSGGDAMIHEIRALEQTYGVHTNLYPVCPNRDKVSRAMDVQSLCQEGRVYIDSHDPDQKQLLRELTMFTGDQNYHDDRVDAFVMGLAEIKNWGGRSSKPLYNRDAGPLAQRDEFTGW